MAKANKNQPSRKPAAADSSQGTPSVGWSLPLRAAVTLGVVWHVFVVFIAPLSVPPTSELVQNVAQHGAVRWYSDPLYLNHGYHFFGPDPPMGGNLIRYTVTGAGGEVIHEGEFPNTQQQWPRLYYHRHMMLADQAAGLGVFGDPHEDRQLALVAYARHLLRKHDGEQVRVDAIWHISLFPPDVNPKLFENDPNAPRDPNLPQEPADPNEPRFFESRASVVQTRADLDTPLVPKAALPPVGGAEEIPIGVGR